jgi:hypothetical protein
MDATKLKVGQKVLMQSGIYGREGTVAKVTEQCVEVELPEFMGPIGLKSSIRFNANGKACDSSDIYHENLWGGNDPHIPGTHEFGPWELEEL